MGQIYDAFHYLGQIWKLRKYTAENQSVYVDTTYSGIPNLSSLFWASACLYYAAENKMYETYFPDKADDDYTPLKSGSNGHSVSNMGIYGFFTYLLCEDKDQKTAEPAVLFQNFLLNAIYWNAVMMFNTAALA